MLTAWTEDRARTFGRALVTARRAERRTFWGDALTRRERQVWPAAEFRAWMRRTRLSQAEVARRLDLSPGAVSLWSRGLRPILLMGKRALRDVEAEVKAERAARRAAAAEKRAARDA